MEVPKFILRLDELPSVVEADDRVWPVYMTYHDAARLFLMPAATFNRAAATMPFILIDGDRYIQVAKLAAWIKQHEVSPTPE